MYLFREGREGGGGGWSGIEGEGWFFLSAEMTLLSAALVLNSVEGRCSVSSKERKITL